MPFFCTLLSKDGPKTDVAWIPKQSQHTDEDYYSFATSQAAKHHLPLALRQGGGNDIGLAGADPLLYTQARASHWVIYGAPRAWTETDVSSFLHEVGWETDLRFNSEARPQARSTCLGHQSSYA